MNSAKGSGQSLSGTRNRRIPNEILTITRLSFLRYMTQRRISLKTKRSGCHPERKMIIFTLTNKPFSETGFAYLRFINQRRISDPGLSLKTIIIPSNYSEQPLIWVAAGLPTRRETAFLKFSFKLRLSPSCPSGLRFFAM